MTRFTFVLLVCRAIGVLSTGMAALILEGTFAVFLFGIFFVALLPQPETEPI